MCSRAISISKAVKVVITVDVTKGAVASGLEGSICRGDLPYYINTSRFGIRPDPPIVFPIPPVFIPEPSIAGGTTTPKIVPFAPSKIGPASYNPPDTIPNVRVP